MATPPQLTPEQRTAALAKAAEARAARAELKNQLKNGSVSIREALASDSVTVGKLKVVSLLESLPGVGKVKARKIMEDIGIADNRRVQGLGAVQKQALLDQLGKLGHGGQRRHRRLTRHRHLRSRWGRQGNDR